MLTPILVFSEQILGVRLLQTLVVEQPIQSDYFFTKFISDLSKDIILFARREPFFMVTRLHIPA